MPPKKAVPGAKAPAKSTISQSKPTPTRPAANQGARKPVSKPSPTKGKNPTAQKSSSRKSPTKAGEKKNAGDKKPLSKDVPLSLTKEDKAAIKLQSHFRKLIAKKFVEKKKLEKEEYEEMIEKLQREAWLEIVKREREEAERERLKEEEERKRKREETKRKKVILEAAFDGDKQTILNVLDEAKKYDIQNLKSTGPALELQIIRHQMALVECEDANNNTPLSEAAAGGDGDTIEFLICRGADVNTVGAFRRTPLYRAAFGGHLHAVQVLLENGADPRKVAQDGNSPEQIASSPDLAELIASWDIQETERLLARNEKITQERRQVEKEFVKKQTKLLSDEIAEAEKAFRIKQKQLRKAFEELNKRIYEHDKCALTSPSKAELTLQAVHDAEADLAIAKQEEQVMREKLSSLKLRLREEMSGGKDQQGQPDAVTEKGVKCNLKELDDVLMRDVGGKIKTDGRWPLIIDPSGQTTIFLRYRDTNYINALNVTEMEPESLRKALIGAIRYGKFLVIDMMQVDMLEVIESRMDEIQKGLFKNLLDKSILQNDRYLSLIRDADGPEYVKEKFALSRIDGFKLVLITNMWNPPEEWLDTFYPIKVIISS